MNKDELEHRLLNMFQKKTDEIIQYAIKVEGFYIGQQVGLETYDRVYTRAAVEWDSYLNKFDIRRREYHLKEKPPEKNHTRIIDTLVVGRNGGRWLDIPNYIVEKFLVLGLP